MNMPLSTVIIIHLFIILYFVGATLNAIAICFAIKDLIKAEKCDKGRKVLELILTIAILALYIAAGVVLI